MKTTKLILLIIALSTAKMALQSQTTPLYSTGFDNATQQAGWAQYQLGGTVGGGWQYSTTSPYSPGTCLFQIYSTASNIDNWFVSPALTMPTGGLMDSIRYMFNGLSTPGVNDTIALYMLSGSPNPALANKTLLFDIRAADYVNDGIYRKKTNLNIPASPGSSYFAIRYKGDQWVWLETHFDNLSISSNALAPVSSFSVSKTSVCKGQSISFTDLSTNTPTNWLWKFQGSTPASAFTSTLANPTITFTNASAYSVSLTAGNASGTSSATAKTFTVNACTGVNEEGSNEISVFSFPNPCSNELFVRSSAKESTDLILSDLLGKQLYKGSIEENTSKVIDMKSFPSGLYLLHVQTKNGSRTTKIVKE